MKNQNKVQQIHDHKPWLQKKKEIITNNDIHETQTKEEYSGKK